MSHAIRIALGARRGLRPASKYDAGHVSERFCDLITQSLNTDFTARRMIGYLSHYSELPEREVVDEMLAILSDRVGQTRSVS